MAKTWTAECQGCGHRMVERTRKAAERALEQHIRATSHQEWLIFASPAIPHPVPARPPRKPRG